MEIVLKKYIFLVIGFSVIISLNGCTTQVRVNDPSDAWAMETQEGIQAASQRMLKEAENHSKEAVTASKQMKLTDPRRIQSLNNLAQLYIQEKKMSEAGTVLAQATKVIEENPGTNSDVALTTFNNLGSFYYDQSEFSKAEVVFKKSLSIARNTYGNQHPATAQSLNNLGMLYSKQNKLSEAESYLKQSLAIREKTLQSNDPLIPDTVKNIAMFYYEHQDYQKARPYFQRAIEADKKAYGQESPLLLSGLNKYAKVLRKSGQNKEALEVDAEIKSIKAKNP